ncbi:MAG: hypothetical protein K2W85_02315 [Phycisphaerales bacterium]|nr:hypothetical protein [Phycisphaerales bacterium]
MGRGQRARGYDPEHDLERPQADPGATWTKGVLIEAAKISAKTFDTIRKSARVPGPSHGGLTHPYSASDLIALIQKAESGRFSEIGAPIAEAWRPLLKEAGLVMPSAISRKKR